MDLGIKGKVAMVAASSKGIGLATAKLLSEEGVKVSLCGRSEENLEKAATEMPNECRTYVVDVNVSEDLDWWHNETVSDLGNVEILVTNTGGPPAGLLQDMDDEKWQLGFDSTLLNVVRMVRKVSPGMREAGWGRIVHITSLVAKEPVPLLPISATLRSGLMALTRAQATDLGPYGITVNSVLPGHTLTDRQTHLAELRAEKEGITVEQALKIQGDHAALHRLAEPHEIAAPIVFLCSQLAGYQTGTNILVDGGAVKGLA